MARIRTVKPEYPKHRKVRKVSRDARLLNIHLWNLADDEGRLQELPNWIIGEVFPTDDDVTPEVLRGWLSDLQVAGLIIRYEVDGEDYIQCHDFHEHQVINKKKESVIPSCEANNANYRPATVGVPDTSHPEGKGMEGEREEEGRPEIVPIPDAPLSEILADLIEGNGANRPRVSRKWADSERLMLDRDHRDPLEAERLIRWSQASEFWRANILSMPKFREKYDQLLLQAKADKPKSSSPGMDNAKRRAEMVRRQQEERTPA